MVGTNERTEYRLVAYVFRLSARASPKSHPVLPTYLPFVQPKKPVVSSSSSCLLKRGFSTGASSAKSLKVNVCMDVRYVCVGMVMAL